MTAAILNKAIANREIDKIYLAVTTSSVPIGTVRHLFRKKSKKHPNAKPTLLKAYNENSSMLYNQKVNGMNASKWQVVEMVVLGCRELLNSELSNKISIQHLSNDEISINNYSIAIQSDSLLTDSSSSKSKERSSIIKKHLYRNKLVSNISNIDTILVTNGSGYYESEIRLITGKTHQIRLQLSALGCPIVGDTRYEPVSGLLDDTNDDSDDDDDRDRMNDNDRDSYRDSIYDEDHNGNGDKNRDNQGSNIKNEKLKAKKIVMKAGQDGKIGDGSGWFGREPKR